MGSRFTFTTAVIVVQLCCQLAHADGRHGAVTRDSVHERAVAAYESAQFSKAAELFEQEVGLLSSNDQGRSVELEAREKWVLSLYNANRRDDSIIAFRKLRERFPSFRFNEDEVLPETVQFFDKNAQAPASPVQQPRVIQAAPTPSPGSATVKPWRWYYLAPLGVGQFLAGSPVRGVIFAALEAGLLAANIALAVDYGGRVGPGGATRDLKGTAAIQTAMNVTFFSMLGVFVVGALDGLIFEP